MTYLSRSLKAAVLLVALVVTPAYADTAHVRIEGDGVSLTRTVEVPESGTFGPDACAYDSPGGAIEVATEGDWDQSQFVSTILGENHSYAESDWWNFWHNREWSEKGICDASLQLQDNDQVLMIVQRDDSSFSPTVFPLFITAAPQTAERGQPVEVTVEERTYAFGAGTTPGPAEGVTVSGGGAAAITDADGRATLTFDAAGTFELIATAAQRARSNAASIVVTAPGEPAPPPQETQSIDPPAAAACFTSGDDGRCGTVDRQAPGAFIQGIREGTVFRRGRSPRELKGTAGVLGLSGVGADGTGILMVKMRLTRTVGPRCSTWSPTKERFVPRPCGAANGFWFKIGESPDWSYLLPERLGRGRYVLDVDAIDRNGNRMRVRRRGENRVVFVVGG